MRKQLVTITYWDSMTGGEALTRSYIVECEEKLSRVDNEIIYNLIHPDNDDMYDASQHDINVDNDPTSYKLTPEKKKEIVEEIYLDAANCVADYLNLPEEADEDLRSWVCSLNVSLEELRNQTAIRIIRGSKKQQFWF